MVLAQGAPEALIILVPKRLARLEAGEQHLRREATKDVRLQVSW
jgi:hypothetical protein